MADLISFPSRSHSQNTRRAYQVHRLAQSGGVLTSCSISARDDGDAKRQAKRLSVGHRAELWASNRLVAEFGSFRSPIATWIKLLEERPVIDW
jgi:hypothetical protein